MVHVRDNLILHFTYYVEITKPDLEALHQSIQLRVTVMYQNNSLDTEAYRFYSTRKNDNFNGRGTGINSS